MTIDLWVQLEQSHCLRQLAIEGTAITYSDKIVASKNVLQRDSIYLQRNPRDAKGNSGWYIGPVDDENDSEELRAFYAYQLLKIIDLVLYKF